MRTIFLHSNSIEFRPVKKALKIAADMEKKWERFEDCAAIFIAVERADENKENEVARKLSLAIKNFCSRIKVKKVVLYPWVHLTSNPASPESAVKVISKAEELIKKEELEVHKSPFGWYKEFKLDVKGHPLAELSREIYAEEKEESKALEAEKEIKSEFFIADLNGNLHKISIKDGSVSGFNFRGYENLKKFALYEMKKKRTAEKEPPHIKIMRNQELVDYEEGSDPGNMRYYPKGKLIKELIERLISNEMSKYGALEVETPIMYDFEHPALKNYLNRFPARQYTIQTPNKKVFLRFSACFGQFLIAKDSVISYKSLPLKLYELTKYSFRVEKRGELSGLRRLRTFTMPDCHCLCRDIEEAKKEVFVRFELAKKIQTLIGFEIPQDFEMAIRITKDFWEKHKEFVKELVKKWNKPVFIEMWNEKFFYFVFKYEWNFVDNLNKASALNTDQIDIENAKRFGIGFQDRDGKMKTPVILHLSPTGAIERVLYALLEREHAKKLNGKIPEYPFWLAPTQIRLIPIDKKYLEHCIKLSEKFNKNQVRCDVDDRDYSLNLKIREAEKEWIPLIIVFGKREMKGKLSVRIRGEKMRKMNFEEILKYCAEKINGRGFKALTYPVLLSKRPKFYG